MSSVLVILETRNGELRPACLETVGAARQIADANGFSVTAIATEAATIDAGVVGSAGADNLVIANNDTHSADAAASMAAKLATSQSAAVVLIQATVRGRDIAPRVAALLDTGFAADCTAVDPQSMVFTRPICGGKALEQVRVNGEIVVASLRSNFFTPTNREHSAEISNIDGADGKSVVSEISAQTGGRPDVAEASVVVSGGRGMGSADNWHLIEAVADAIPGSGLGASRAVVDSGWRPHSEQVGQTGKTVSPELYIAAGISGAIQHLAGMNSSKVIVAINKDADAPIFRHATYGLVGDALEILPELAAELKK
ncbi:MAG: electron transfer flavoprotein subunit alpha/FixB family protein [Planctomycetota bacterium]|jgi:electron transfer flavoprotein alpha subunit|nr:electron transfer flavoprotein subunit alpha/FixB family protein [Planctomycetota bacterium]